MKKNRKFAKNINKIESVPKKTGRSMASKTKTILPQSKFGMKTEKTLSGQYSHFGPAESLWFFCVSGGMK